MKLVIVFFASGLLILAMTIMTILALIIAVDLTFKEVLDISLKEIVKTETSKK